MFRICHWWIPQCCGWLMKKSKASLPSSQSGISPCTTVHGSCSTSVNCSVIPTCKWNKNAFDSIAYHPHNTWITKVYKDRQNFVLSFDLDMISTVGWLWTFGQASVKYIEFLFIWPLHKQPICTWSSQLQWFRSTIFFKIWSTAQIISNDYDCKKFQTENLSCSPEVAKFEANQNKSKSIMEKLDKDSNFVFPNRKMITGDSF